MVGNNDRVVYIMVVRNQYREYRKRPRKDVVGDILPPQLPNNSR
jgi:hypothetical protein